MSSYLIGELTLVWLFPKDGNIRKNGKINFRTIKTYSEKTFSYFNENWFQCSYFQKLMMLAKILKMVSKES